MSEKVTEIEKFYKIYPQQQTILCFAILQFLRQYNLIYDGSKLMLK